MATNELDTRGLSVSVGIKLADVNFSKHDTVDMLIGAEIFCDLLKADQIKLGPGLPLLQNTLLGWVLSGPVPTNFVKSNGTVCILPIDEGLPYDVEKFWRIEEMY